MWIKYQGILEYQWTSSARLLGFLSAHQYIRKKGAVTMSLLKLKATESKLFMVGSFLEFRELPADAETTYSVVSNLKKRSESHLVLFADYLGVTEIV
jgi:hypothetical protein